MVYHLLNIYYFMIIARIFLTWIIKSYTLENHPIGYWLCALTDPFLRLFRRLPFATIGGMIDISPIFALWALTLAQRFVRALSVTQSAPFLVVLLGMIFHLFISIIAIVKTVVLVFALILLFRLLHILFSKQSGYNVVLSHIDFAVRKLLQGPLSFLQMAQSKFTTQVTALFILTSLLTYLLALSESSLGGFFQRVLSRL
ncbi:YggT family protein [Candidatus Haliotispira prima]|uniref:YggT family protein n=1 Tax=Candidatus Haliotispira prima TaxID=3034016 RepID=A0ABY8MIR6_9SPIO|nr:YggT family protein [Candidatus Haliotispira prima]